MSWTQVGWMTVWENKENIMNKQQTMTTNTPGPWIADKQDTGDWHISKQSAFTAHCIVPCWSEKEDAANAALIASAPALLEALKRVDDEVPHWRACAIYHLDTDECDCFQRDVTAAIALAKGTVKA